MKVFDYECPACKRKWEQLFLESEEKPAILTCSQCGGQARKITIYALASVGAGGTSDYNRHD